MMVQVRAQAVNAGDVDNVRPPPWSFGFQTNERYLQWDESAQRQLLKMHVATKLGKVRWHAPIACTQCTNTSTWNCLQDVPWVEAKLQEIVGIIPDLSGKIDRMKADIVIQLVDTQVSLYAAMYC